MGVCARDGAASPICIFDRDLFFPVCLFMRLTESVRSSGPVRYWSNVRSGLLR